jgi:hypothetical protein
VPHAQQARRVNVPFATGEAVELFKDFWRQVLLCTDVPFEGQRLQINTSCFSPAEMRCSLMMAVGISRLSRLRGMREMIAVPRQAVRCTQGSTDSLELLVTEGPSYLISD